MVSKKQLSNQSVVDKSEQQISDSIDKKDPLADEQTLSAGDSPDAEDFDLDWPSESPQPDHQPNRPDDRCNMSLFSRIPVRLTLEVTSVEISLAQLMSVNNDSVIELDKMAGEPLDIRVNGILFGKAEVVVVNDKYGLRVISFNDQQLAELAE